ncbi:MAG: chorismate-binding protein [Mycobacteriales bacterium]
MSVAPLRQAACISRTPLGLTQPLVVRTVPLPDPGPLLAMLAAADCVCWLRNGEGFVGWGTAARVATSGRGRFADAHRWWESVTSSARVDDVVGEPGTGLVAFGSFAFAPTSAAVSSLVVPRVVIGHRAGRWWVTTAHPVGQSDLLTLADSEPPTSPGTVSYTDGSLSALQWQDVVGTAVSRLDMGEADKVVLARDVEAHTSRPVDVRWLLQQLADGYPSTWTFAVDGLVGATPELLVRLDGGRVTSRVLAGTMRRGGDDEQDLMNATTLMRSSKDLHEHEFAVRSVADALLPWCRSTNVPETPFVLPLPNVMHLATDVTGVLDRSASSLELVAALHPSAAVCGTPTAAAAALIDELEGMDRGRYAGPVGWLGANGDGEWGLALRCAQVDPANSRLLRLYAGCGIVTGSQPEAELAESAAKLLPMREALAASS